MARGADDRGNRRPATKRLAGAARLRAWWRHATSEGVDRQGVIGRIKEDSGLTPRYIFMTLMSAGIAVLGLLQSSPAVVIGAMLISPLMSPILGLGFSLALFDFAETRRSLMALAVGSILAVAFSSLVVVASPLKETTAEILSRTQPNLFDLLIALFAALAGVFAIIRGLSGTIVGVAIATALTPPLAVVGYGLATWNLAVLVGALALFVTNFVTIALSATVMARLYGFGSSLSSHQSWLQTVLLIAVFIALSVPLGLSLNRIAGEATTVSQIRALLLREYGARARVSQLAVDFQAHPIAINSVVITPRSKLQNTETVRKILEHRLGRTVTLQLDQVLVDRNASTLQAQRAQLEAAEAVAERSAGDKIASLVAAAAGASVDQVIVDNDRRRASAPIAALPDAGAEIYQAIEVRAQAASDGWEIRLIPPFGPLPTIHFAYGSDVIDDAARKAVLASAWAARRWNASALRVPGLQTAGSPTRGHPPLAQRRAIGIAAILQDQHIQSVDAPAIGQSFRLTLPAG
jgi:uncharacterized hydrophobic protein (TIGR00271 family)